MLGCACLGCGSNRNPESYLHWQQSTSVVSDVACCPKHVPMYLASAVWHLLCGRLLCGRLLCGYPHQSRGICYPHNLCQSACACTHTADTTDQLQFWHKSHFKVEAWRVLSFVSVVLVVRLPLIIYVTIVTSMCCVICVCGVCGACCRRRRPSTHLAGAIRRLSALGCTPGEQAGCDSR